MALTAEHLYSDCCGEIIGILKREPASSNKDLADCLSLSYRVMQSTTARMEKEKLIVGTVIGAGTYTKIEWQGKK